MRVVEDRFISMPEVVVDAGNSLELNVRGGSAASGNPGSWRRRKAQCAFVCV
ncbi:MAG: hypothetical protein R2827_00480 [Bdellovibrionales bacterium]